MRRTPAQSLPLYEKAMGETLGDHRKTNRTSILAGDLNINSWKDPFREWIEENELWGLANPATPTYETGTTDDAIIAALRTHLPEGLIPGQEEYDKEIETSEKYPAYVTEKPILGKRMALILPFRTYCSN